MNKILYQDILFKISQVLEDVHCSGCIADMHCDFWTKHIVCLNKIKDILEQYQINEPLKVNEKNQWTE